LEDKDDEFTNYSLVILKISWHWLRESL
jgi:hypothetical protein